MNTSTFEIYDMNKEEEAHRSLMAQMAGARVVPVPEDFAKQVKAMRKEIEDSYERTRRPKRKAVKF